MGRHHGRRAVTVSPTQRTLAYCRKRGMPAAVVERWNPHARIRQDLFGFIDVVVLRGDRVLGVQATSGGNVAARVTKAREQPAFADWLACADFEVWGWRKVGPRGKRKLWKLRRVGPDGVDIPDEDG